MFRYLRNNSHLLWIKRNHPESLTTKRDVELDGLAVSTMGNRYLLDYPDKAVVQCSRRLTEQQIADEVERFLAMAKNGTVLVSACISPGEKDVMRAAHDAGARQIILLENGFSTFRKPGGAQFDSCAAGRPLLVAPWPHYNERPTITREPCLQLNELALSIAAINPEAVASDDDETWGNCGFQRHAILYRAFLRYCFLERIATRLVPKQYFSN